MTAIAAGLYLRASVKGATEMSPEQWERAARAFIAGKGYVLDERHVYIDVGKSTAMRDRQALNRVLGDLGLDFASPYPNLVVRTKMVPPPFDVLVTPTTDQLTGTISAQLFLLHEIHKLGV